MDDTRILELCHMLELHECDIFDGKQKLSLTASLLQSINIALQAFEFNNTVSFDPTAASRCRYFQELFRRTPKLAVTQRTKSETWRVDLNRFEHLKYLELSRIPIHLVEGLQSLKSHLEVLVCVRCADCFEDIAGPPDEIWDELRTAKLSYNNIDFISSFVNMPLLQYLDLSNNKLSDGYDLQSLTNLKHLNLSFNYLVSIPVLSDQVCKKLQVLILNNNYIQDLAAVVLMENLTHLDVSGNLLADHSAISPLLFLPVLVHLNLLSNPLSYHPYHRFYTCSYLNRDISRNEFLLDGNALSSLEQSVVGSRGQADIVGKRFRTASTSSTQTCAGIQQLPVLEKSLSSRKVGKVREAVIMEGIDKLLDVKKPPQLEEPSSSKEHLETKKQLEGLREKIGKDHWLHSQSGSFVQDLLGLQRSDSTRQLTSTPNGSDYLSSSPRFSLAKSSSDRTLTSVQEMNVSTGTSEFITAQTTQNASNISDTEQSGASSSREEGKEIAVTVNEEETNLVIESEELSSEDIRSDNTEPEEEEAEGSFLWLVQKISANNHKEELFLTLDDIELREKNTISGRTVEKWYLESVESCVKLTSDPVTVQLSFQTAKKNRQERTYIMEYADAQVLLQKISALLESRPLSAMNQIPFRCMKCSSLFSQEINYKYKAGLQGKTTTLCPACGSSMVIEIDEVPLPSASVNKVVEDSTPLQSSIGSADSLQNIDSSGTKSEAPTPRRYDSDIEVISNPSQSSIEVLEVQARLQGQSVNTPNRKRSSEERQTVAVPQLVTVPEVQTNLAGLTESSSSGSLTDSVCTAYESQPLGHNKKVNHSDTVPEESSSPSLSNTYASLLEGLLKNVGSKFSPVKAQETSVNTQPIFSYSDFTQVDHRIKLYLFQHMYQHDNEDLLFLLKGHIFGSAGEDFEGCIVLSTHCLYILQLTSQEISEETNSWLQFRTSYLTKEILSMSSVLWSQGVRVELSKYTYLILLQDSKRTQDFLTYLADSQVNFKVSRILELNTNEKTVLSKLVSPSFGHENEEGLQFLQFVVCCSVRIVKGEEEKIIRLASVFITNTDLVLLQPHYTWVLQDNSNPDCICMQKISNIVDVLRDSDMNMLVIQFLDETENQEEVWILDLATAFTLESIVESIRTPWETLFSVPLQISKPAKLKSNLTSVI